MARSLVASDNFNRADATDLGANWTFIRNSANTGGPQIAGNRTAGRSDAAGNHVVSRWDGAGTFSDDQYAQIKIGDMGGYGPGYCVGVVVRCSADLDAAADFYGVWVEDTAANGSTKTVRLFKTVNGTKTDLTTTSAYTWSMGDTISLEVEGTALRVYKNTSTLVLSTTDSALSTGKPGLVLQGYASGGVPVASGDDWEGGDIAAVPADPSGVTVGSVTASTGTVSWTDNSSNESGFKVRYAASPYLSWTTATGSVAASPYIVTGLTDGTSYKAGVAAFNGSGDSSWIESGVFTTTALSKLRPNADTSAGSWSASSGSVLYSMIDETSADDADYITSTSATTCKIKFETSTDPADNSNHSLRIRARSTSGTLTVKLVQGDPAETTILSWAPTLTSSFANYQYDLSTAEASVITDYSALYLKLTSS